MGYYCCVPQCNSNSKKKNGVSFHGFTKDKKMREIWIEKIRRDFNCISNPFKINNHTKICSLHFLKSDFKIASEKWRLKPNAVPSIFAWTDEKLFKNYEKLIKIPNFSTKNQSNEQKFLETNENHKTNDIQMTNEHLETTEHKKTNDIQLRDENRKTNEHQKTNLKHSMTYDIELTIEREKTIEKQKTECEKNKNIKIEQIENKKSEHQKTNDHQNATDYRLLYLNILSENRFLKSELENIKYRYRDQEELYDNLVVVNKSTQRENEELRKTIFVLQEYLKNLAQKQLLLDKQFFDLSHEKIVNLPK